MVLLGCESHTIPNFIVCGQLNFKHDFFFFSCINIIYELLLHNEKKTLKYAIKCNCIWTNVIICKNVMISESMQNKISFLNSLVVCDS